MPPPNFFPQNIKFLDLYLIQEHECSKIMQQATTSMHQLVVEAKV